MSRPEILQGVTTAVETGSGRVHVTINHHEGKPYEVFVMLGKAGSEERALTESLGRLLSLSLRRGATLEELASPLRGISSESVVGFGPNRVLSVPDAVGRVLQTHTLETEDNGDSNTDPLGGEGDSGAGRTVQVDGSRLRTA